MLRLDAHEIDRLEQQYPGITEQIMRFERADVPDCPKCGSHETAKIIPATIGRTINISAATTKVRLAMHQSERCAFACLDCDALFG